MNYLSYRSSLVKLNRQRRKIGKYYKKKYADAKKKGNNDETQEINALAYAELGEVNDEIQYIQQRYLISIATMMMLPVPPVVSEEKGGLWERSLFTGNWQLTKEGITELKKIIRIEKKEKFELLSRWIAILVGLIGAITGLVAVIMK